MTKMKNPTRRALMLSVMALVLCFTMLVGTTYAWFTDSVTSGKNKIVAGNLDIELYHTSGAKTVTETDDNIGIPSTVTTIGKEAFQLSGVIALTIPDNVTTIEEGAFRDMPNLEDLYIVGNPTIANFAARNCKNLIKVTLEGDDVTFTGTSMVFTNAESGEAKDITIYVVNDTVKERLIAAQGSARNYTVEVVDIGNIDDPFGDDFGE